MSISKVTLWGIALLAIAPCPAFAFEVVQWQIATPFPETSKPQKALAKAAKRLARSSREQLRPRFVGRDIDPSTSMLELLQRGDGINAALIPPFELGNLIPDASLYDGFFLFAGFHEANTVRQSMDKAFLKSAQHQDYAVLGITGLGFVHLMSDEAFVSLHELSGRYIQVPVRSAAYDVFFGALNIGTRPPPHESAPSLMLNSTVALILDKRIPRLSYLVSPPVHYVYLLLVARRADWEALSVSQRAALQDLFDAELRSLEEEAHESARRASRVLQRAGMQELLLPSEELARLRASVKDERGSPELKERLSHELARLRE